MATMKTILVSAGIVCVGLIAGRTLAFAQCTDQYPPPPGTPTECIVVDGEKVIVDAYGTPVPGVSEGSALFEALESQERPCGTYQQPQSFDINVQTRELGVVRTTLDRNRPFPLTTIISNQVDEPFPATVIIEVPLLAEVEAYPGRIFQSRDLVKIGSEDVRSFPFVQQTVSLQGEIEFVDVKDPDGPAVFTLTETRVVLTTKGEGKCSENFPPPVGTPSRCVVINGQKVWVDEDGNSLPGESYGGAAFTTVENGSSPCKTVQQAEEFEVNVRTEKFGEVRTRLDRQRHEENRVFTTITANQYDAPFPATVDIKVYLLAEVESFPGRTFRSRDIVRLTNREVRTYPFEEQEVNLNGTVEFVDVEDPEGRAVFSLSETRVILRSE